MSQQVDSTEKYFTDVEEFTFNENDSTEGRRPKIQKPDKELTELLTLYKYIICKLFEKLLLKRLKPL